MSTNLIENIMYEWNAIDNIFAYIDKKTKTIGAFVEQRAAENEVDAEIMIEAATKHLTSENEKLKATYYPRALITDAEGFYVCPKCKKIIDAALVEQYKTKHCLECGQRIYKKTGGFKHE